MKQPAVYILASKRNGTLYVGVKSDLAVRVWQHRNDIVEGFTKQHGVPMLVYFELHDDMESASFVKSVSRNGIERGSCG